MKETKREIDPARGERIKFVRTEILRMRSQEKLAEELTRAGKQTSRGAVGNWELGKEIGLDSLTAICKLSGVDLNWLAYNDGGAPTAEMRAKPALVSSYDPDGAHEHVDPDWDGNGAGVIDGRLSYSPKLPGGMPETAASPGMGLGRVDDDRAAHLVTGGIATGHPVINEWVIPPSYVRNALDAAPSQVMIMPVIGHSMEPILKTNDRVLVDISQNVWVGDAVYIIDDGDGVMQAKTIRKVMSSSPPSFEIISEANPDDKSVVRRHDQFRIVGRVVGRFTRM